MRLQGLQPASTQAPCPPPEHMRSPSRASEVLLQWWGRAAHALTRPCSRAALTSRRAAVGERHLQMQRAWVTFGGAHCVTASRNTYKAQFPVSGGSCTCVSSRRAGQLEGWHRHGHCAVYVLRRR